MFVIHLVLDMYVWLNIDNFVQMTPSQILVLTSSPSFKRVWDLVMMRFWHSFTTSLGPEVSKPKSHTYILEQKKLVIHYGLSFWGRYFSEDYYLRKEKNSHWIIFTYMQRIDLPRIVLTSKTRILNLQLIESLWKIAFKIFLINKVYLWKNKCYFDFHLISLS